MLTGSSESVLDRANIEFDAHDTTLPFVLPLYDFVRRAAATDVKIVGVCFGHQIIANALGGKSGRGDGWEVGTYETEATEEGRKIWGDRVVSWSCLCALTAECAADAPRPRL
jgi:GMP synthase-like glutamine amidotransferase